MARCLAKVACLQCGSSDSLQPYVNDDGSITGFCFGACQSFIKDPFGDNPPDVSAMKVKTPEDVEAEVAEIRTCKFVDFEHRGLGPEDWSKFGVRVSTDKRDGKTPYAIHHPYLLGSKLVGYMTKLVHKKSMWIVGDVDTADPYGWWQAKKIGGRNLYITEGQEDAIAARKILRGGNKGQYKDQDYAVISLPNGTKSLQSISRLAGEMQRRWENIILVFDDDLAGRNAVGEVMKILPKATSVILPAKDANACLVENLVKQAREAMLFRAEKPKNSRIVWGRDVLKDALKEPEWGVSWPWKKMTELTRGIRTGETIYLGAGQKMGCN